MRWTMKLALLAALAGAHLAWAQPEVPPDPVSNPAVELKSKLMYMRFDWASANNSNGLFQDGRPMDVGFFLGSVAASQKSRRNV